MCVCVEHVLRTLLLTGILFLFMICGSHFDFPDCWLMFRCLTDRSTASSTDSFPYTLHLVRNCPSSVINNSAAPGNDCRESKGRVRPGTFRNGRGTENRFYLHLLYNMLVVAYNIQNSCNHLPKQSS